MKLKNMKRKNCKSVFGAFFLTPSHCLLLPFFVSLRSGAALFLPNLLPEREGFLMSLGCRSQARRRPHPPALAACFTTHRHLFCPQNPWKCPLFSSRLTRPSAVFFPFFSSHMHFICSAQSQHHASQST